MGMCFGVRDAIELALQRADTGPLTILGDLVHNPDVLRALRARASPACATSPRWRTPAVMVTAHGASDRLLARTRASGLEVIEATCPLVHVAHRAVKALLRDGYHPVIIGQRDHAEVRGLTEISTTSTSSSTKATSSASRPTRGSALPPQTTQPIARVRHLVDAHPAAFPATPRPLHGYRLPADQAAAAGRRRSGGQCDAVVVIGGAHSNNTRELVRHLPAALLAASITSSEGRMSRPSG